MYSEYNGLLLRAISKLSDYQIAGEMDRDQITDVLEDVRMYYIEDSSRRIREMARENYHNYRDGNSREETIEWIRSNVGRTASLLGCCMRTIYRKLQRNSFTLIETITIREEMEKEKAKTEMMRRQIER